jgi:cell division protein FtsN
MAHRNRNSRRRNSTPGWVWMLFGLGLGLIVAIGVYLRLPAAPVASAASVVLGARAPQPEPPVERERPAPKPAAAAPEQSRFEFYEILPQFEVVVPDEKTEPARVAAVRSPPAQTPGSFLLQAGSFSAAADADRLQANLALLGFEAHVQRVTIDNAIFNRVRIGPIRDADTAKQAQRRLRDAGIDTLLMQVPK